MTSGRYVKLAATGELQKRAQQAKGLLAACTLCPRKCAVNRLENERGDCCIGEFAEVASFGPHFGEESPLVGRNGSGTIFFYGCNLHCVFCQNHDISHGKGESEEIARPKQLARVMLHLQEQGCHNINLVTPSHVVPQILEALVHAVDDGLSVPLVYNSGGYDSLDTLVLLDGIIDIYMPDVKFMDKESAGKYLDADDYPEGVKRALKEMQRQVGDLQIGEDGLAVQGLLVRHLLMPDNLIDSKTVFSFLAKQISADCYINIMDQYRPCFKAGEYPELLGSISAAEYNEAVRIAKDYGLKRIDKRNLSQLMKMLLRQ